VLRNRVESCDTAEVYAHWISTYVPYIHSTPQARVSSGNILLPISYSQIQDPFWASAPGFVIDSHPAY
jgi:hypothetical protein